MKQEILDLQAKLDGAAQGHKRQLSGGYDCFVEEHELASLKKLAGRDWRNSVMERRIYGRWAASGLYWDSSMARLTKKAKREAEDWARQTKRTLGRNTVPDIL